MDIKSQFETLMKSKGSEGLEDNLIELINGFLEKGIPKDVLIEQLVQLHLEFMIDERDDDDIVLNILDYLEGWCSPHMKL